MQAGSPTIAERQLKHKGEADRPTSSLSMAGCCSENISAHQTTEMVKGLKTHGPRAATPVVLRQSWWSQGWDRRGSWMPCLVTPGLATLKDWGGGQATGVHVTACPDTGCCPHKHEVHGMVFSQQPAMTHDQLHLGCGQPLNGSQSVLLELAG